MQTPDQNPETPRDHETSNSSAWHSVALNADHKLRSLVDRVRPTGSRFGDWLGAQLLRLRQVLAPLLDHLEQKLDPRVRGGAHRMDARASRQHKRPSRLRSVQAGLGLAVLGVVGVVFGSLSQPQDPASIQAAAAAEKTPEQARAEAAQAKPEVAPKADPGSSPAQERSAESLAPSPAELAQANMTVPANAEGIDVSNHNGSIDWSQVAASGKKFTFVLASDGESFTNSMFHEQYQGAKDAGLLAGGYHFGRPSGDAVSQADRLLQTTGGYKPDGKTLPPVLDLEVDPDTGGCYGLSTGQMHEWTQAFTDRVKSATGQDAIIYASPSFWQNCMGDSGAFSNNPLWLASYDVDSPSVPGGWGSYAFWQYTDSGSVPGVSGDTDLNRFQGSGEQLKELAR